MPSYPSDLLATPAGIDAGMNPYAVNTITPGGAMLSPSIAAGMAASGGGQATGRNRRLARKVTIEEKPHDDIADEASASMPAPQLSYTQRKIMAMREQEMFDATKHEILMSRIRRAQQLRMMGRGPGGMAITGMSSQPGNMNAPPLGAAPSQMSGSAY